MLASGGAGGTIRLWDARSGKGIDGSFAGHLGAVNGLAFGSADEVLVSGGLMGTIKRWDPASGEQLVSALAGEQPRFGALAMSPDGRILAAGGRGGRIDLWDLATGKKGEHRRAWKGIVQVWPALRLARRARCWPQVEAMARSSGGAWKAGRPVP